MLMSGEEIVANQEKNKHLTSGLSDSIPKKKVDINVLLNRVIVEKKKEKFENLIFVGLIALIIIVTGIVASL